MFRIDGRAFHDRQDVALNAFAAHLGTVRSLAPGNLVDFVDENDAALLDTLDRRLRHAFHVDQLLLFFLCQELERLGYFQFSLTRLPLKETGEHVLEIDVDFFDRRSGDDLERRKRFFTHVDLDRPVVETAGSELLAKPLTGLTLLIARRRRVFVRRERSRWG